MARPEKEAVVLEMKDKLERAKGLVLADFRGLSFDEMAKLRRRLKKEGVEFRVIKNTLVKIAAEQIDLSDLLPHLTGPTAIAFGYDDALVPVKVLADYSKKMKKLDVKAGLFEGEVIGADQVKTLAALPAKEILLSQLLGALQAPIAGFANVLGAPARGLAMAVNAIAQQKSG